MVILGILALTAFALVFGYIVMFLWNYTITPIFSLKAISYWQAVALVVLAKILFGKGPVGKHHKHKHGKQCHKHFHDKHKTHIPEEETEEN